MLVFLPQVKFSSLLFKKDHILFYQSSPPFLSFLYLFPDQKKKLILILSSMAPSSNFSAIFINPVFLSYYNKKMQNNYWFGCYLGSSNQQPPPNMPYYPPYPQTDSYYPKQSDQLFYQQLKSKCEQLQNENQQLKKEINVLKLQRSKSKKQRRKVQRRSQDELTKNFSCPYEKCKKEYASNLALNLHIRIKHNGGTKKERDQLAESLIKAQKEGRELPQIKINLPPNYLKNYKEEKLNRINKLRMDYGGEEDDFDEEDLDDEEAEEFLGLKKEMDDEQS